MKNKVRNLVKRFNAWLIRVDEWFRHPSPLSLLISALVPAFFLGLFVCISAVFPDYLYNLSSEFFSDGFSYSVYLAYSFLFLWFSAFSFWGWLFDLIKYIISLFRKSSAPADDK